MKQPNPPLPFHPLLVSHFYTLVQLCKKQKDVERFKRLKICQVSPLPRIFD